MLPSLQGNLQTLSSLAVSSVWMDGCTLGTYSDSGTSLNRHFE